MPNIVKTIFKNTVPLHTLSLAIHTARGGAIKQRIINKIFKHKPAILKF